MIYHDREGKEVPLERLCQNEPEWEASRIRDDQQQNLDLQAKLKTAQDELDQISAILIHNHVSFAGRIRSSEYITSGLAALWLVYERDPVLGPCCTECGQHQEVQALATVVLAWLRLVAEDAPEIAHLSDSEQEQLLQAIKRRSSR